jgi:hypothetical protein
MVRVSRDDEEHRDRARDRVGDATPRSLRHELGLWCRARAATICSAWHPSARRPRPASSARR